MKYILRMLFPLYLLFLFAVAFPEEREKGPLDDPSAISEISLNVKMATKIEDRMPVDVDSVFDPSTERIYCWSAVAGVTDTLTIYHIWNYNGRQQARVPIKVTGSYFRAFTFQSIKSEQIGVWTVYIVDEHENLLGMTKFKVEPVGR
jgi:hypothetical protein